VIKKTTAKSEKLTSFSVSGEGRFPIHLLAKCKCFPETVEDSRAISGSYGRRTIRLISCGDMLISSWIVEGWHVTCKAPIYYEQNDYDTYHTWPC
jgi:hypothetical protein